MRGAALLPLCCGLVGCTPPGGSGSDGGTPVTVRVMTWNLRQLGADGGTAAAIAGQVQALAPDLLTVQELTSAAVFDDLLARLPAYQGRLGMLASTSGNLRQAVLWNPGLLTVEGVEDLFTSGAEAGVFPRPPLGWVTRVTDRGARFGTVAVHLKAGARAADEHERITALGVLDEHLRSRVDAGEASMLLLGDFNEALSDPRAAEAFAPFTSRKTTYRVPTLALADAGAVTFLPAHLYFDHLVTTAALDGARDGGVLFVPPLDAQVPNYLQEVSDHLPVVFELEF